MVVLHNGGCIWAVCGVLGDNLSGGVLNNNRGSGGSGIHSDAGGGGLVGVAVTVVGRDSNDGEGGSEDG